MVKLNLGTPTSDVSIAKPEKPAAKAPKRKRKEKPTKQKKVRTVTAPTNRHAKLIDEGVMSSHNFMSVTRDSHIDIYRLNQQQHNRYEIEAEPTAKTAVLKFILTISESNAMTPWWSNDLWMMVQSMQGLDPRVSITAVRSFEKLDPDSFGRRVRNRQWTSVMRIGKKAQRSSNPAVGYDKGLHQLATEKGQAVISFGAELLVTAPTEVLLEETINLIREHMLRKKTMRNAYFALDLNKQDRPFTVYGTGFNSGHNEVTFNLSSADAATTALIVDTGGDRTPGSEYVGKSVGKLIHSHAAYNFMNPTSMFVGNDSLRKTYTEVGVINMPSQVYLAQVASRAYILRGRSVTHVILDDGRNTDNLESFPLSTQRTIRAREGKLNIIEPIATMDHVSDEQRVSHYNGHVTALATLLNQFRAEPTVEREDFINNAKSVIREFFETHGYWDADVANGIPALFGDHGDFKTVNDFLVTVRNEIDRLKNLGNSAERLKHMNQLFVILNEDIMSNARAFDVNTDPIVDEWVRSNYRVLDVTGFTTNGLGRESNDANVMVLSYLNILMNALENGDLIVFHGASHIEKILPAVRRLLKDTNKRLDICYTEGNETRAATILRTAFTHEETGEQLIPDLTMVDLFKNDGTGLVRALRMSESWVDSYKETDSTFFVNAKNSVDYIWLDHIL